MGSIFTVKPSKWEMDNAQGIRDSLIYQMNNGHLPDLPIWDMLKYRYEFNPIRFEKYHPNITKMILNDHIPISIPDCHIPPICIPVVCHPPVNPPDCNPSVPEPSSIVAMSIGVPMVLYWLKRKMF